ncbi:GNAT family N-acetyltransferase [Pseudoalteromonas sp. Z1A8]|uniref:GNAT family N-acetyltransferase n=1 Tax=Pseudoalteromonas sp. Z1A8 TaxID=2686354 RepID=UPI00140B3F92|nr:GNAT family N-acetyltransferase [Pseudoalteromonas sp. Z1A8]
MNIKYRIAKESDLEDLVTLLADDVLGSEREDVSRPLNSKYRIAFQNIVNDQNNELIIIDVANKVAGMLQLTYIPYLTHMGTWRCLIEGVRISTEHRGQGLGEQMFKWAINRAEEKGCNLVQLTSDKMRPDALRFYKKLGFNATHEGFKLKISQS